MEIAQWLEEKTLFLDELRRELLFAVKQSQIQFISHQIRDRILQLQQKEKPVKLLILRRNNHFNPQRIVPRLLHLEQLLVNETVRVLGFGVSGDNDVVVFRVDGFW